MSSFNKMCVEVDIGVERGKARIWIVVLEAQRTFVELRWKWGWIKAQIWKLETKQVKRVFPASCGRPDNSWAAAKTMVGSNFTGAGHVTWLLLTTSDTYSQAHVWTQLLWEPRQQGGLNQLVEPAKPVSLMRKAEKSCLYTRYPKKKLLTEFLGL